MKMTIYSWIILYSCLVFGSGILCDRKVERRQAVSSCFVNAEDKFNCSNGVSIEKSWVCDGLKDCSDGSDERNELCARNEDGTNMTTDCGRVYTNQELINNTRAENEKPANSQKALYGTAPWNVGVYQNSSDTNNSNYQFLCGGSIISSNLVVSAAHCFWKKGMSSHKILIDDGQYKIAVGKYDRNITIIDNNTTQIMNVEIVYLKEDYYGLSAFNAEDIAIIVLKNRISFSNSVAPICIDWNGKYNEVNGDQGKIVGWGRTKDGKSSPILLEASLPYIDRRSCRDLYTNGFESYVTFDKFCAGSALVSGQGVSPGYGGAGLSFFHSNSYYLTGVTSCLDPVTNNSIAAFTDIKYHIQWIHALYNRYSRQPVPSCSVNAEDKFNCSNGVSIEKSWVCDGLKDCSDGSDERNELCARNEDGTNMTTDCGRVYTNQELINNGQKALYGTAPWNVGVYQNSSDTNNSNYQFLCGGSIISSNLVVSAAHCFWKKGMSSHKILIDDGQYKIAVGKYDRNITIIDNNITQIMNVKIIYLKEDYYGLSGFYAEDIAIIVLKNRISFSNSVAPICIDWNGKYNEVNGDQGKIVEWGRTNDGKSSPILLEASLPYIDRRSCRDLYTNGFESYVTFDKFCAGSALGQGVGKGCAGGGLSFFHSNSYYLTGVMSIKDPETNNSVAVFTEVKFHIQWIRELYNKHN